MTDCVSHFMACHLIKVSAGSLFHPNNEEHMEPITVVLFSVFQLCAELPPLFL
jgi:hypothetical protein